MNTPPPPTPVTSASVSTPFLRTSSRRQPYGKKRRRCAAKALSLEQQRKHAESVRRRLILHRQGVLTAYAAKVRKVLNVCGTHKFIHPHTPLEYVLN